MKFYLASFVWLVIGLILAVGIFQMAVRGNPWLLIIWAVAFIGGVAKIGCSAH